MGVEKVAISSAAVENPELVTRLAEQVGNQSIVVVLDVKKRLKGGKYEVWTHNGLKNTAKCPVAFAQQLERLGVGEIVVNSIDNDGMMKGYDLALVDKIRESISVPLTVLGGAGSLQDIGQLIKKYGIIGAAAGVYSYLKEYTRRYLSIIPARQKKMI